ncbi:MAG TPA: hypothetical protein DCX85_08530, partial [Tyzzerella sp.]|nr:hypothetical protein [Tyzzerella sp.]
MKDERLEKLADVLVNYSTKVKKGDRVAISAEDAALPFIKAVARAAVKAGALVEYYIDVPDVDAELLKNGTEEQYARENIRFGACAKSDVWISAWGSENTKTMQSIEAERLKQKRLANKDNRKIYSERMGTGELRWCGTQFPTNGDAQNAGMSLEEYEEMEQSVCMGPGSCPSMETANTMCTLMETLGLALPGSGTTHAVYTKKLRQV